MKGWNEKSGPRSGRGVNGKRKGLVRTKWCTAESLYVGCMHACACICLHARLMNKPFVPTILPGGEHDPAKQSASLHAEAPAMGNEAAAHAPVLQTFKGTA